MNYPLLAPRIPLAAPLAIFLEFTNRCNFKCSFCPESLPDYKEKAGGIHRLSWSLFRKICTDIKDIGGVKVLRFYGLGETLLNPDATEMITEACQMGISEWSDITTNGSMLNTGTSLGLISSGLDCLRVSTYGTTAEEMRNFTQSHITPEHIRDNMRGFLHIRKAKRSPKPLLIAKIASDSSEEIARFRAMYADACDELEVVPLHNWTGQDRLTQISRPHKRLACPSPFYQIKINADGVVVCCATDWRRDTAMGNVSEESLASIWNGERMRQFRLMHLNHRRCDNAACSNCDFIDFFHDNIDSLSPEVLG